VYFSTPQSEIALPDLHDLEIGEVLIDRIRRSVSLVFINPVSGERLTLKFFGVSALHVGPLGLQNVVLEAAVLGTHSTTEIFDRALLLTKEVRSKVESGQTKLFYAEPSWGAECAIAFQGFSL